MQLDVSFGVDGEVRLDFVDALNCGPVLKNMVLGVGSPIALLIRVHVEEALGEMYAKLGCKEMSPNEYVAQFRKSTECLLYMVAHVAASFLSTCTSSHTQCSYSPAALWL